MRASHLATVNISVLHSCDRNSCLGCKNPKLQTLCYAAQQCSIARCIGTVVNQKYFLCDVGLALQSMADQGVSYMLGAWIVFTETYTDVLKISLDPKRGVREGMDVGWVDDAFFGYVCSAKDMYGQFAGTLTAAVGAGLIYHNQNSRSEFVSLFFSVLEKFSSIFFLFNAGTTSTSTAGLPRSTTPSRPPSHSSSTGSTPSCTSSRSSLCTSSSPPRRCLSAAPTPSPLYWTSRGSP